MVTVVVGCSLPNGVKLRLHHEVDEFEPSPNGMRTVKRWRPTGDEIELAGNGGELAKIDPRAPSGFGYRLHTLRGKQAELFLAWTQQQGKDCYLIDSKALIWHEQADHVEDEAVDLVDEGVKTGLEPLNPEDPPREFRKVKVAEEQTRKPLAKETPPFIHHVVERARRTRRPRTNDGQKLPSRGRERSTR
jgi:hypothetical protein